MKLRGGGARLWPPLVLASLFFSAAALWPEIGKRALFVPEDPLCQAFGERKQNMDGTSDAGASISNDPPNGALHLTDLRKGVEGLNSTQTTSMGSL